MQEERNLKLMEEGEYPSGPGKAHQFVLGMRNDILKNTGRPKYLPIKTCEKNGVDCEIVKETGGATDMGRWKRNVFTHIAMVMGVFSSLPTIEETVEACSLPTIQETVEASILPTFKETGIVRDMDRKKEKRVLRWTTEG